MKTLVMTAALFLIAAASISQNTQENPALPELHKIQKMTLSPSYGCQSKDDARNGYGKTILALSSHSDGPELLFEGACGGPDFLTGSTAGDDMSVIADLGKIRLEDLRTDQAFNLQRVNSPELYSKFAREVQPEFGHTYALLINKSRERGLIFFTVSGYIPNERLDLRYAVKEYQVLTVRAQSSGFDWTKKSN